MGVSMGNLDAVGHCVVVAVQVQVVTIAVGVAVTHALFEVGWARRRLWAGISRRVHSKTGSIGVLGLSEVVMVGLRLVMQGIGLVDQCLGGGDGREEAGRSLPKPSSVGDAGRLPS